MVLSRIGTLKGAVRVLTLPEELVKTCQRYVICDSSLISQLDIVLAWQRQLAQREKTSTTFYQKVPKAPDLSST